MRSRKDDSFSCIFSVAKLVIFKGQGSLPFGTYNYQTRRIDCNCHAEDLKLTANRHVVGVLRGLDGDRSFRMEKTHALFRVRCRI